MPDHRRLPGFAVVGAIGFVIDAVILTLLMTGAGLDPYRARAASFTAAVTATWYLNRRWVFGHADVPMTRREYMSYVVVQVIGAAINLLVFVVAIEWFDELRAVPVIPLAMGAALALVFNFAASSRFVFARPGESGR